MGAMLTYGSYLRREDDIMGTSITISVLAHLDCSGRIAGPLSHHLQLRHGTSSRSRARVQKRGPLP